jgi:hypothetical protein
MNLLRINVCDYPKWEIEILLAQDASADLKVTCERTIVLDIAHTLAVEIIDGQSIFDPLRELAEVALAVRRRLCPKSAGTRFLCHASFLSRWRLTDSPERTITLMARSYSASASMSWSCALIAWLGA